MRVSLAAWISVLACLSAVLFLLALDGATRLSFVEKISDTSFSEAAPHRLPVAPGTREEWLVLPYPSMDARWWVLHTERMLQEGSWRVRHTDLDNAPQGREVHWSSCLMWFLVGLAWLQSLGTEQSATEFLAEAALVAGPVMMVAFVTGLAALVARRFGVFASLFFAVVILTSYPIVRAFVMGEADHHGMVVCFAAAGVFCLLAGGCGLARKGGPARRVDQDADEEELLPLSEARRWFVASGIFGGASLWVSAATALPIIAGCGMGGILVSLANVRGDRRARICPELWVIWGVAGCLGSLGFYLLEYFPSHMGWRLEINHPLYATAWLGGAFLLSKVSACCARGKLVMGAGDGIPSLLALAAVAAPVWAIIRNPQEVFWVSDKFLLALHKEYIMEFQSLFTLARVSGSSISWLAYYPWPICILVCSALLGVTGQLGPIARRGLLLLAPPVLFTQALTVVQVRWASAAFAMWSLCALILAVDLLAREQRDGLQRWSLRGLLACCWLAIGITMLPQILIRAEEERTCLDAPLPKDIAGNLLLRDIAHRLIQSSPDKIPLVLTGPNASTEMAYHAGLQTMGTLYWENMPGLKRAARIFSVPDEASALRELTAAGVTHIVVPSWDNFAEAYARLLAKAEGVEDAKAPFFKAIVEGDECPDWLRPFAYPIPTNSGLDTKSVKIFAVLPQQTPFESLYYRGVYFFETGQLEKARRMFTDAAGLRPADERPRRYLQETETRQPQHGGG